MDLETGEAGGGKTSQTRERPVEKLRWKKVKCFQRSDRKWLQLEYIAEEATRGVDGPERPFGDARPNPWTGLEPGPLQARSPGTHPGRSACWASVSLLRAEGLRPTQRGGGSG